MKGCHFCGAPATVMYVDAKCQFAGNPDVLIKAMYGDDPRFVAQHIGICTRLVCTNTKHAPADDERWHVRALPADGLADLALNEWRKRHIG